MRLLLPSALAAILLAACAEPKSADPRATLATTTPPVSTNLTYVPILAVTGKVAVSNPKARFVILSLTPGVYPPKGTHIYAYRDGVKVADLRIAGPQWDDKTVADILSGDPQVNDQINDN